MTATKMPLQPPPSPNQGRLSRASFARFAGYITSELGIMMPESKLTLVQGRLQRRIIDLGMTSLDQYAEYFFAAGNSEEREHFINVITTNKTDFFREPDHFRYLLEVVLPEMSPSILRRSEHLKLWSAGCSSGEEAYTLAMLLSDYATRSPGFDFSIVGTDISTRVLQTARTAIYQEAQIAPVPAEFRRKYLLRSRNRAQPLSRIVPLLRRKVTFHPLNLMDSHYRMNSVFHTVFFRNVMIYFDKPTQEDVINKICRHLSPGGFLFVGHSESLTGLNVPVKSVKASIYRKST